MWTLSDIKTRIGSRIRNLSPSVRRIRRRAEAMRARGLAQLAAFSVSTTPSRYARVLVDGQWDNANYWIRYAFLRKALGLASTRQIGILGHYNRNRVRAAFAAFGFASVNDYGRHVAGADAFLPAARNLLSETREPGDIHRWSLPGGVPAALTYDGILKRQRRACVDLADPRLPSMVAESLSAIDTARCVLNAEKPDLLVMSHTFDFSYGALVWLALSRGIPVIGLYGDYGTNRFILLEKPEDIFSYPSRPVAADEMVLSPDQRTALAAVGRAAIESRLGGRTADVSAIYAYRRRSGHVDRKVFAERFGWDPTHPIIGVYAPNWFDYPNGSGRFSFRDFREWAESTIAVAVATPHVNWLFKAHPCDEWYGSIHGARLVDLVREAGDVPHVRLCDAGWNGRALLDTIDGLVTVHGTAGIEFGTLGKPVLVPYRGWYGASGFVETANSVQHYLARLTEPWWENRSNPDTSSRASMFAGWYFAAPDWHGEWFLPDDANQDAIWWHLEPMLKNHAGAIAREVGEIADWIKDGHRYFQIFKLRRSERFSPAQPCTIPNAATADDPRQSLLAVGAR